MLAEHLRCDLAQALEDVFVAVVSGDDEETGFRVRLEHVLHDCDAVALGHAKVEHHDIGMVLFEERDGLFAVAGFRDDFHIRLLVDHGGEAVSYYGVIVCEDDPNLSLEHCNHHALRLGNRTLTRVPVPG